jgi:hypothetical protein
MAPKEGESFEDNIRIEDAVVMKRHFSEIDELKMRGKFLAADHENHL